jgi:hypothetical protein
MKLVMDVTYSLYEAGEPRLGQDILKDINGSAIDGIDPQAYTSATHNPS